ncbi:MAG: ribosome maturation factor RimP [Calditrichia bacterium]|nr:ribosome maturation factor RimP [Calditrichia bacterium]MCK5453097.1 ribosome maturation factor RimP [Calditrichia bacterium]
MENNIETIKNLVMPVLEDAQIYLIDMQLRGGRNNQVLSIYVDTEEGVTLQQIAKVTREIEGLLDLEEPISGKYRLDISSPGIDRPLTEIWQFKKNIGRNLKVQLKIDDTISEKTGKLIRVDEDNLWLMQNNQEIRIPMSQIMKAVIQLKW